ncbi:peroxiredoxin family protein [Actinomycetospora sp. TBRC 11914]|uniref:peroxiredoxin family protein n=1 Tax=Actinomycetospora sp. TBRC 11914 TaxID=2729387 RepID=UPI00145F1794|nr:peroxiredoxin family protein [Actinomycetospora sp. TBRC 11914]NMO92254.1 redoxin domain-containing protein [Actinomycetospora sp. TBRC 11914]
MTPVAEVGQPAPDFTLEGTDGPFTLSEHRGERVVLLFYTMDRGSVCARQFRSYAANRHALDELGATLVGINGQGLESHRRFRRRDGVPIPLLSDPGLTVASAYGAAVPVVGTRRSVVVVDEEGVLRHRHVHTLGLGFATVADLRRVLADLGAAPRRLRWDP